MLIRAKTNIAAMLMHRLRAYDASSRKLNRIVKAVKPKQEGAMNGQSDYVVVTDNV